MNDQNSKSKDNEINCTAWNNEEWLSELNTQMYSGIFEESFSQKKPASSKKLNEDSLTQAYMSIIADEEKDNKTQEHMDTPNNKFNMKPVNKSVNMRTPSQNYMSARTPVKFDPFQQTPSHMQSNRHMQHTTPNNFNMQNSTPRNYNMRYSTPSNFSRLNYTPNNCQTHQMVHPAYRHSTPINTYNRTPHYNNNYPVPSFPNSNISAISHNPHQYNFPAIRNSTPVSKFPQNKTRPLTSRPLNSPSKNNNFGGKTRNFGGKFDRMSDTQMDVEILQNLPPDFLEDHSPIPKSQKREMPLFQETPDTCKTKKVSKKLFTEPIPFNANTYQENDNSQEIMDLDEDICSELCSTFSVDPTQKPVKKPNKSEVFLIEPPVGFKVGFQTASNKPLKFSEKSMGKVMHLFDDKVESSTENDKKAVDNMSSSFKASGNKSLKFSSTRKTETDSGYSTSLNNTTDIKSLSCGFKTASNKSISIKQESLLKAKSLVLEDKQNNELKLDEGKTAGFTSSSGFGFQTASKKSIKVSETSLKKAHSFMQSLNADNSKSNFGVKRRKKNEFKAPQSIKNKSKSFNKYPAATPLSAEVKPNIELKGLSENKSFCGFKTASDKPLKISHSSMNKVKSLFEFDSKVDFNGQNNNVNFAKTEECLKDPTKQETVRFSKSRKKILNETQHKVSAFIECSLVNTSKQNISTTVSKSDFSKSSSNRTIQEELDLTLKNSSKTIESNYTQDFFNLSEDAYSELCSTFVETPKTQEKLNTSQFSYKCTEFIVDAPKATCSLLKGNQHFDNKNTWFVGFTTASKKPLKVSEKSLDKVRNLFDFEDDVKTDSSSNSHKEFKTAQNESKTVACVSDSLSGSFSKNGNGYKAVTCIPDENFTCGFQTASNKTIKISKESMNKASFMLNELASGPPPAKKKKSNQFRPPKPIKVKTSTSAPSTSIDSAFCSTFASSNNSATSCNRKSASKLKTSPSSSSISVDSAFSQNKKGRTLPALKFDTLGSTCSNGPDMKYNEQAYSTSNSSNSRSMVVDFQTASKKPLTVKKKSYKKSLHIFKNDASIEESFKNDSFDDSFCKALVEFSQNQQKKQSGVKITSSYKKVLTDSKELLLVEDTSVNDPEEFFGLKSGLNNSVCSKGVSDVCDTIYEQKDKMSGSNKNAGEKDQLEKIRKSQENKNVDESLNSCLEGSEESLLPPPSKIRSSKVKKRKTPGNKNHKVSLAASESNEPSLKPEAQIKTVSSQISNATFVSGFDPEKSDRKKPNSTPQLIQSLKESKVNETVGNSAENSLNSQKLGEFFAKDSCALFNSSCTESYLQVENEVKNNHSNNTANTEDERSILPKAVEKCSDKVDSAKVLIKNRSEKEVEDESKVEKGLNKNSQSSVKSCSKKCENIQTKTEICFDNNFVVQSPKAKSSFISIFEKSVKNISSSSSVTNCEKFVGYKTASKKDIVVSENAYKKAGSLMQEVMNSESKTKTENEKCFEASDVTKKGLTVSPVERSNNIDRNIPCKDEGVNKRTSKVKSEPKQDLNTSSLMETVKSFLENSTNSQKLDEFLMNDNFQVSKNNSTSECCNENNESAKPESEENLSKTVKKTSENLIEQLEVPCSQKECMVSNTSKSDSQMFIRSDKSKNGKIELKGNKDVAAGIPKSSVEGSRVLTENNLSQLSQKCQLKTEHVNCEKNFSENVVLKVTSSFNNLLGNSATKSSSTSVSNSEKFVGFKTASKKDIKISKKAYEIASNLFKDVSNSEENFDSNFKEENKNSFKSPEFETQDAKMLDGSSCLKSDNEKNLCEMSFSQSFDGSYLDETNESFEEHLVITKKFEEIFPQRSTEASKKSNSKTSVCSEYVLDNKLEEINDLNKTLKEPLNEDNGIMYEPKSEQASSKLPLKITKNSTKKSRKSFAENVVLETPKVTSSLKSLLGKSSSKNKPGTKRVVKNVIPETPKAESSFKSLVERSANNFVSKSENSVSFETLGRRSTRRAKQKASSFIKDVLKSECDNGFNMQAEGSFKAPDVAIKPTTKASRKTSRKKSESETRKVQSDDPCSSQNKTVVPETPQVRSSLKSLLDSSQQDFTSKPARSRRTKSVRKVPSVKKVVPETPHMKSSLSLKTFNKRSERNAISKTGNALEARDIPSVVLETPHVKSSLSLKAPAPEKDPEQMNKNKPQPNAFEGTSQVKSNETLNIVLETPTIKSSLKDILESVSKSIGGAFDSKSFNESNCMEAADEIFGIKSSETGSKQVENTQQSCSLAKSVSSNRLSESNKIESADKTVNSKGLERPHQNSLKIKDLPFNMDFSNKSEERKPLKRKTKSPLPVKVTENLKRAQNQDREIPKDESKTSVFESSFEDFKQARAKKRKTRSSQNKHLRKSKNSSKDQIDILESNFEVCEKHMKGNTSSSQVKKVSTRVDTKENQVQVSSCEDNKLLSSKDSKYCKPDSKLQAETVSSTITCSNEKKVEVSGCEETKILSTKDPSLKPETKPQVRTVPSQASAHLAFVSGFEPKKRAKNPTKRAKNPTKRSKFPPTTSGYKPPRKTSWVADKDHKRSRRQLGVKRGVSNQIQVMDHNLAIAAQFVENIEKFKR